MSFAFEIKEDIINKKYDKNDLFCLIQGLIFSLEKQKKYYQMNFNNQNILEFVKNSLNFLQINFTSNKNKIDQINLNQVNLNQIRKNKNYFLSGLFLSCGSISKKNSTNYHLEFKFQNQSNAKKIIDFFQEYYLKFSILNLNKHYLVYAKKASTISDFLKIIKSFKNYFIFEDIRIKRDYKNHFNRYVNLDISNQDKIVKSFLKFKRRYQFIIEKNLVKEFKNEEINFFELRKKYMYKSLNDLALIYYDYFNIKVTKSCLNHWLIKLRKVYELFKSK